MKVNMYRVDQFSKVETLTKANFEITNKQFEILSKIKTVRLQVIDNNNTPVVAPVVEEPVVVADVTPEVVETEPEQETSSQQYATVLKAKQWKKVTDDDRLGLQYVIDDVDCVVDGNWEIVFDDDNKMNASEENVFKKIQRMSDTDIIDGKFVITINNTNYNPKIDIHIVVKTI